MRLSIRSGGTKRVIFLVIVTAATVPRHRASRTGGTGEEGLRPALGEDTGVIPAGAPEQARPPSHTRAAEDLAAADRRAPWCQFWPPLRTAAVGRPAPPQPAGS